VNAKTHFKVRSLQPARRVPGVQSVLAVSIISQKQEVNLLLLDVAKTNSDPYLHVQSYEIVINDFKAGCTQ
jgi:hypothetical protein